MTRDGAPLAICSTTSQQRKRKVSLNKNARRHRVVLHGMAPAIALKGTMVVWGDHRAYSARTTVSRRPSAQPIASNANTAVLPLVVAVLPSPCSLDAGATPALMLACTTVWCEAARVLPLAVAVLPSSCSLDAGDAGSDAGVHHGVVRGGMVQCCARTSVGLVDAPMQT